MTDQKTILIVEDEEDQRTWMTAFFEDHGYSVVTAVDGQVGFETARTRRPDLITLDISMDNESGIRCYRNLCETPETEKIPVVMVTGVSPDFKNYIERQKKVPPPSAYFEKPVDRDALLKKVMELV